MLMIEMFQLIDKPEDGDELAALEENVMISIPNVGDAKV